VKRSELREMIREIMTEEDQLMSDKEWNAKIANIKKSIEDMNKGMDNAIKKGDKKTLKHYMDQADKMKKILNK